MRGRRSDRTRMGALFTPFRTRTAHIVQFGSIGIAHFLLHLRQISATAARPAAEKTTSAASLDGRKTKTIARLTTDYRSHVVRGIRKVHDPRKQGRFE